MVALVLQRYPPLGIRQVDPCYEAAVVVAYLVLGDRCRRTGVVQQQSQARFHR
jgi:hypothetical protein